MKRILISLALCLVMVGLMVSPVLAAAQKVTLYQYSYTIPGAIPDTGSGFVVWNSSEGGDAGAIELTVSLKNGDPLTEYVVWIGPAWNNVGTMTTNAYGKANFHINFKDVAAGTYVRCVALNSPMYNTEFISDNVNIIIK